MDYLYLFLHRQPFNDPLSGTTRVSRYQKKHSPLMHTHEKEKEGFAQTTGSAAWELIPLTLLCASEGCQTQLSQHTTKVGRMASTYNRLRISMSAVLVAVPTVTQNSLLHPLSTSLITARHLLDVMVQAKITEADALTIRLDAIPSGLSVLPPPSHPPFVR